MKKFLFAVLVLISSLASSAQTTILKIGTDGYVTIDGANYTRGYLGSAYSVIGGDSVMEITVNSDRPPQLFIYWKKASKWLNGDNGNTPFSSMAALHAWMNAHFEFVDTSSGGGGITAVSVRNANGFLGSSSGGATPILTLFPSFLGIAKSTSISGVNSFIPAVDGTDYLSPTTGVTGVTAGTGLSGGTITTTGTIDITHPVLLITPFSCVGDGTTVTYTTTVTSGYSLGSIYIKSGGVTSGDFTATYSISNASVSGTTLSISITESSGLGSVLVQPLQSGETLVISGTLIK